jgi:DtxR family Mn-dependent transcriptional regulator
MTAVPNRSTLTESVEDYLKAIYTLSQSGGIATTTAIADRLAVATPSVTGMLQKLAQRGLVHYEWRRGATLTEAGERSALGTIRRHAVIGAYLHRVLGCPWDLVHGQADRLEHVASDELIERMARTLGRPLVTPP